MDHPRTQNWKRELLGAAGIPLPGGLGFVAVDLETAPYVDALLSAGLDPGVPALVSWLGVSMYLPRAAIASVLGQIRRLAPGSEFILEYALAPSLRDEPGRVYAEHAAQAVAERGEPYRTFLTPEEASGLVEEHGLRTVEHVRMHDAVHPACWHRSDALRPFDFTRLLTAAVSD